MKINQSRRNFIQSSAGVSAIALCPGLSWSSSKPSYNPLPIPELLTANRKNGFAAFELNAQYGTSRFFAGVDTPTLGYNGNYLGPTIRVKNGEKVKISVNNKLNEITTVHWHGMILPARMDGGPHQEIKSREQWKSEFAIKQPAATLFYHSHAHRNTGPQVYGGLAGLMIIDEESGGADLPSEYGIDDIPVLLQDRDFANDGSLQYLNFMPEQMIGKHGKTLLVNGALSPVFKAKKPLLRLRMVNASNARFYNLVFNDRRSFQIIASDGGLLDKPVTLNRLVIAPAERYEILVDLSDRKRVMLQSVGGVGNTNHGPMGMMGMDKTFDVLLIDAEKSKSANIKTPQELVTYPDWSQVPITANRSFALQMGMGGMMGGRMGRGGMSDGMMRINNQSFDMGRIDFAMKIDSYEIWEISNPSPVIHPFHVHNTQFRVLSRNGNRPYATESGFKDTVVVHPNEFVRILIPTGPYADARHPYMYHCHILEHEDGGMMGQFVVDT
ncbi:multicopper oxidase family protein [Pseudomonadota bacterium]